MSTPAAVSSAAGVEDYPAHYDVIVLGGGPGGYLAAERLGHAGRSVLLVEADRVGGVCLNVGCIPTKSLLHSAKLFAHAREGEQFGVIATGVRADWAQMQAWKGLTVDTLVAGVAASLKRDGVRTITGHGRLVGPGRIAVTTADAPTSHDFTADQIIVATGSVPVMPPIPGAVDNPAVVDSTGLLAIDEIPKRLAIIGGGVIGVEFASMFAALGSIVDVVEMQPEICPFMPPELAAGLRRGMSTVNFHLGCQVTTIHDGTVEYTTSVGEVRRIEADVILMAVGRRPRVDGWGAAEAGLDISGGAVRVDDTMRTNLPGVWAVGDVTGRSLLAHAAYRMADIATAHILDPVGAKAAGQVLRRHTIPWAVYSRPEAAGVGLTPIEAAAAGYRIATSSVPLVLSGRFVAEHGLRAPGQVLLVADADTGRVLGIQMLGDTAPETIWGAATVLETDLTVTDLQQIVFPHPTVSEAIREAAWRIQL